MTKFLKPLNLIFVITLVLNFCSNAFAQITTDGSVGPINFLLGPDYRIGADLGTQSGSNLFHSFDKFNVNTGESATFIGPLDIKNVIGRVTGKEFSRIDGRISSLMPNADIYLINSSGIVFGKNALLDVPGSFYASTASEIIFEDETKFRAILSSEPQILSAEPPADFGFLDDTPASIAINGSSLRISDGKTLGLIGKELVIEGGSTLEGGNILIRGDADLIETSFQNGSEGKVLIQGDSVSLKGNRLSLKEADTLRIYGDNIDISNSQIGVVSEGEGKIFFRGGKLVVDNSKIALSSDDGQIKINADDISIANGSLIRSSSEKDMGVIGSIEIRATGNLEIQDSNIFAGTDSDVNAPMLRIYANKITLSNAQVQNGSVGEGSGDAGRIVIRGKQEVNLKDNTTISVSIEEKSASGKRGKILVLTPKMVVIDSTLEANTKGKNSKEDDIATIWIRGVEDVYASSEELTLINSNIQAASESQAAASDLKINAKKTNLKDNSTISVATFGFGQGGNLQIDAEQVNIEGASSISARASGIGNAGAITINASNSISNTGNSQIFTESLKSEGGNITLKTLNLILDSGSVKASVIEGSQGGDIEIDVETISLNNGGQIISSSGGQGHSGNITVIANNQLNMDNDSIVSANSSKGKVGDITIKVDNKLTINQSKITTKSQSGEGGNIAINTPDLTVENNGFISTSVGNGSEQTQSANLDISVAKLALQTGGYIKSSTNGKSSAGEIAITATEYIKIFGNGSGIFSTSENDINTETSGNAGKITISGKNSSGEIVPVPSLTIADGGKISTTTRGNSNGGEIELQVEDLQVNQNSSITTATRGDGNENAAPANIYIDVQRLTLNGDIESSTNGKSPAGNIAITASEYINLSGGNILSTANKTGHAGEIRIGKIAKPVPELTLAENSKISTTTSGSGNGGNIELMVDDLRVNTGASITTISNGDGNESSEPANINIAVQKLTLNGDIESSSTSKSPAGNITITASEYINMFGGNIFSTADFTAGKIRIGKTSEGDSKRVPTLTLTNSEINTTTYGVGNSGQIELLVDDLQITDNSRIVLSTDGGQIKVNADNNILITNNSRIRSTATMKEAEEIGSIEIRAANNLKIQDSHIFADTSNEARAGTLDFSANKIELNNVQINGGSVGEGSGDAGTIVIKADSQLELTNNVEISAKSGKNATNAGNIEIETDLLGIDTTTISTSSEGTGGGNISIIAKNIKDKRITNSKITASVTGGKGEGGNLEILGKPKHLFLDNTDITAEADKGDGGEITINAEVFIASSDSKVSASSDKGIDGEVNIDSSQIEVESISLLPNRFVNVANLIKNCVTADVEEEWSIVQVGYGDSSKTAREAKRQHDPDKISCR